LVGEIKSGDVIEIRFRDQKWKNTPNCLEFRQVHVDLDDGQAYRLGRTYADRITCEFTHYRYYEEKAFVLHMNFLEEIQFFPLVAVVKKDECKEVVVKRPLMAGSFWPETIWEH
jgi:hypothetical protein